MKPSPITELKKACMSSLVIMVTKPSRWSVAGHFSPDCVGSIVRSGFSTVALLTNKYGRRSGAWQLRFKREKQQL